MVITARSPHRRVADLIPITTPNDPEGWYIGAVGQLAHRPQTQDGRWKLVRSHTTTGYQSECQLWVTTQPAPPEMTRCPDCMPHPDTLT